MTIPSRSAYSGSTASDPAFLQQALGRVTPILAENAGRVDVQGQYPFDNIRLLHEAGLLSVALSRARGGAGFGLGTSFVDYFGLVIGLARACSNTAQLFTVQSGSLFALELLAAPSLVDSVAFEVHQHGAPFCFVAAEVNERFTYDNKRTNIKSFARRLPDGRWQVKAEKAFATGSVGSRFVMFYCATSEEDGRGPPESVIVLLPREHPAVKVHDTWDGIGQRATASGLLVVEDTVIDPRWIVGSPADNPKAAILSSLYQLGFAAILTGIGEAALDDTRGFVLGKQKATVGFTRAADEPAIQAHIGDIRIALSASRALVEVAARALDAFVAGSADIADALIAVYQAKVHASSSSLEAGSRLFQIGGARSTSSPLGYDRHWRNARTLTLHDSVDKQKAIVARYALGIERPLVSNR